VQLLPKVVVDALPLRLWKPANLYLGGRLHLCVDRSRTVEWNGRAIARGRKPFPRDEFDQCWPSAIEEP
jgi:hypothetical protein